MKSPAQIEDARKKLARRMLTPGLTEIQKTLIMGVVNALVWVADGKDCRTVDRLLSDEPMAPGKDHRPAFERLDRNLDGLSGRSN